MCKDNYADHVSQITPRGRSLCRRYDGCTAHWPPVGALTGSNVRHNNNYDLGALMTRFGVPAGRDRKRSKTDALAEDGALNPAPEKVRDLKFQEGGFFDPGDIVQVKYEMLRRASVEKASVTEVSEEYGIRGRPTIRPRRISTKAALPDSYPGSEVPAAHTRSRAKSQRSSGRRFPLANRYARASWRSRSRRSSASMSIQERSNERSVQKKLRDDWDHGQFDCACACDRRRPLREAALGHAW